jgi:hypothetical protein
MPVLRSSAMRNVIGIGFEEGYWFVFQKLRLCSRIGDCASGRASACGGEFAEVDDAFATGGFC